MKQTTLSFDRAIAIVRNTIKQLDSPSHLANREAVGQHIVKALRAEKYGKIYVPDRSGEDW